MIKINFQKTHILLSIILTNQIAYADIVKEGVYLSKENSLHFMDVSIEVSKKFSGLNLIKPLLEVEAKTAVLYSIFNPIYNFSFTLNNNHIVGTIEGTFVPDNFTPKLIPDFMSKYRPKSYNIEPLTNQKIYDSECFKFDRDILCKEENNYGYEIEDGKYVSDKNILKYKQYNISQQIFIRGNEAYYQGFDNLFSNESSVSQRVELKKVGHHYKFEIIKRDDYFYFDLMPSRSAHFIRRDQKDPKCIYSFFNVDYDKFTQQHLCRE